MLASTLVTVLGNASDMSAILVLGIGAGRRGAGCQVTGDLGEGGDAAVTEGADQCGSDDRAVGVLGHPGDLFGGGDADAHAGTVSPVGAEAADEGAGGAVEFGALPRDAHGR